MIMARKDPHERRRHTPEQVIRKLREADQLLGAWVGKSSGLAAILRECRIG